MGERDEDSGEPCFKQTKPFLNRFVNKTFEILSKKSDKVKH